MAPLAFVIAGAVVTVKVAILPTRGGLARGKPSAETRLVIVARPQAVGIECVDQAVTVIVNAVAALIRFAPAQRFDARGFASLRACPR
jgi:hypothetical protein